MSDSLDNYRLYGKGPTMKQFKAMNWNTGALISAPVSNLIFATVFFEKEAHQAYQEAVECNPDWQFKLVKV